MKFHLTNWSRLAEKLFSDKVTDLVIKEKLESQGRGMSEIGINQTRTIAKTIQGEARNEN